jgi:hypothetical protein
MENDIDRPGIHAAGKHYVMQLLRRYNAAPAPKGSSNSEIVVSVGTRRRYIQVKARRVTAAHGWKMDAKHEKIRDEQLFYCFVALEIAQGARPIAHSAHILPSEVVADVLTESHHKWLTMLGRDGLPHKDSTWRWLYPDYKRVFGDTDKRYAEGWLNKYDANNAGRLLKLEP